MLTSVELISIFNMKFIHKSFNDLKTKYFKIF